MRRQARVLVWVTAWGLALGGCASLPTDNEPRQGPLIARNPVEAEPTVRAAGPVAGADAAAIVRGFELAMTDPSGDYQVARQFLGRDASNGWNPHQQAVGVLSSPLSVQVETSDASGSATTMTMSAHSYATVATDGRLQPSPLRATHSARLKVTRSAATGGQWRITELPADLGRWLSRAEFDRSYQAVPVYYASMFDNVLVPDMRWVPRDERVASAVARLQVAEPPEYLKGAVRTGLPGGSRLEADAVPVDNGVATVSLTGPADAVLTPEQRALALAQMGKALSFGEIDRVRLLWNGVEVEPADGAQFGPAAQPYPCLVLRSSAGLSAVTLVKSEWTQYRPEAAAAGATARVPSDNKDQGARLPAAELLPQPAARWGQLAASHDLTVVAGVANGQVMTWTSGEEGRAFSLPGAGHLTTPSFDEGTTSQEYTNAPGLWVASSSARSAEVWWMSLSDPGRPGTPSKVRAPWLAGRTVTALRVAPDDTRVAMVLTGQDGRWSHVAVSAVVRDPVTAKPLALTEPLLVGPALADAQDVTWASGTSLVAMGREAIGADLRAFRVGLAGDAESRAATPGGVSLLAQYRGDDETEPGDLFYVDEQGGTFVQEKNGWLKVDSTVADLVMPGE